MTLYIQQPDSTGLLKRLDQSTLHADSGGGIFAYATKGGVEALFSLPGMLAMMARKSPYHLIVGIDAITNAETIFSLRDKVAEHNGALEANVFFHQEAGCTFHPKFSWFRNNDAMSVLTGSGNLTVRGLGQGPCTSAIPSNWEAFYQHDLSGPDAELTAKTITNWLEEQKKNGNLRSLDDPEVLERAIENAQIRYRSTVKNGKKPKAKIHDDTISPTTTDNDQTPQPVEEFGEYEILIRELPSTRPGQGDVGQKAHSEFFGHHGIDKHILLQYVDLNDVLSSVNEVWLFFNPASANYRLELDMTKETYEYGENDERMIIVASKLDLRSFRYTILRPNTDKSEYAKVNSLLGPICTGGRRLMRECFTHTSDLLDAWPEAPSNLIPLTIPALEI